jgi:hypothetical protein
MSVKLTFVNVADPDVEEVVQRSRALVEHEQFTAL